MSYMLTNQSASANTWTLANFNTKIYDTSTNFSTSTNLFTAPINGFYIFTANVVILGSGTAAAGIGINIGALSGQPTYQGALNNNGANANPQYGMTTPPIQLTAGQTVSVYAYNNTSGGFGSGINFTWFGGYLYSRD